MGKLVEMLWDCPYCKTKGILGRYRNCPNCGNPRGKETKFYMPDEIKYVDEEKAEKISRNPDWQCSFCGSLNNDSNIECKSCGALREVSDKNYFDLQKEEISKDGNIEQIEKSLLADVSPQKPERNKKNPKDSRVRKIVASFVVLGLILLGLSFIPHKETLKVVGFDWNREIQIEQLETFRESGWNLPSDARLVDTSEEIHHYNRIIDHYETKTRTKSKQVITGYETVVTGYKDLGNGYSEEITETRPVYETEYYEEEYEEPVYINVPIFQTKYYYDIDKWQQGDSVKTNGNDKSPYWGEVILDEKKREGKRLEEYRVKVQDEDQKQQTHILSYSSWKKLEKNDELVVQVNFWGSTLEMKDEDGCVIE